MGLLDHEVLVFKQKAKLIELTTEFAIRDGEGNVVGSIAQVGQSFLKKLMRFISRFDQFMTHRLAVREADGTQVLEITRPAKFFRSKLHLKDGAGAPIGSILQQNMFGKIRFAYVGADGAHVGGINAENWRAWNFSIADGQGAEVGRITKKWSGLGRAVFTNADNYVLEIPATTVGPLRLFALASAAGVDLALKQDSRGLG